MKKIDEFSFPSFESLSDGTSQLWKAEENKVVGKTPIFDVKEVVFSDSLGKKGKYINLGLRQWVCVIPVFRDSVGVERFVMERQFRFGSKSLTLEFPGGIVDAEEEPSEAAIRELLEETGIKAHTLTLLGQVNPNSSFMTNTVSVFLAEDLENTGTFNWDDDENIDIFTIPVRDAMNYMGTGMMDNGAMLLASFLFLKNRGFEL